MDRRTTRIIGACVLAALTAMTSGACLDAGDRRRAESLDDPIPEPIERGDLRIGLEIVADGLTAPTWGTFAPGVREDVLFVTDQDGLLWAIDVGGGRKSKFLDLRDRLVRLNRAYDERGLLGVAFHPEFRENGRFYTYTSEPAEGEPDFSTMPRGESPDHQSVLLEWRLREPADRNSAPDRDSPREILRIDQPQMNHNGGTIAFGPDGLLYVPLGDGGSAHDRGAGHVSGGNGQEPGNVFGTILRIDPAGSNGRNGEYGVPRDNPFVEDPDALDEIYAYGLRNTWGIAFDRDTGRLYAGDVGQEHIEEINLITAGGNYGWRRREGAFDFHVGGAVTKPQRRQSELVDPIAQYDHDEGSAVIGGFVYRGSEIRELKGAYVFGDYTGRPFYLEPPIREDRLNDIREFRVVGSEMDDLMLLGFGEDAEGELYVLANETGSPSGETGVVLKIIAP